MSANPGNAAPSVDVLVSKMASQLGTSRAQADALIPDARAGKQEAIEQLVIAYWSDAYRVAYLLLQDAGAAEEVAQDALLRAVRALDSFDLRRPFAPWLCRIAANCAHDALRRQRRRPQVTGLDDVALSAGDDDLADEVARSALPEQLERALAALNPDTRTAVVLRHLLDYPPEEIAEIVGVPAGTVRSRIHRGLVALRLAIEEPKEATK